MSNNCTPGPWIVEETSSDLWIGTSKGSGELVKVDDIVVCIHQDDDYKESVKAKNRANARLIASAPEMLHALILAKRQMLEGGISVDNADAYNTINNAIKKANQ